MQKQEVEERENKIKSFKEIYLKNRNDKKEKYKYSKPKNLWKI